MRSGRNGQHIGLPGETDEPLRTPHSAFERGQATLEMTVALTGALLLMLGSFKVFLWCAERLIRRQQAYECTRVKAASTQPGFWEDPARRIALRIFGAQPPSSNPCEG